MAATFSSAHPASFRDPAGHVVSQEGVVYRKVYNNYSADYDVFVTSGLKDLLIKELLLLPFEEVNLNSLHDPASQPDPLLYRVLKPTKIPFISYPSEWCFSALRDAALVTLAIQREALKHKMILKDAPADNVQFIGSQPLWIDHLSFERWQEGAPWKAYRQFCTHFLLPLALMSYGDVFTLKLHAQSAEGIPLSLSGLLPLRTYFKLPLLMHLHLHNRFDRGDAGAVTTLSEQKSNEARHFSLQSHFGLVDSLEKAITSLPLPKDKGAWSDYYKSKNAPRSEVIQAKEHLLNVAIERLAPKRVYDFGANSGHFSRVAAHALSERGVESSVVALESDHECVDLFYRELREENRAKGFIAQQVLPLWLDLTMLPHGGGITGQERMSFIERDGAELGIAYALIHHLALGSLLPFEKIAAFFANTCQNLLFEFVPGDDPMAVSVAARRGVATPWYTEAHFREVFERFFTCISREHLPSSGRVVFLYGNRKRVCE